MADSTLLLRFTGPLQSWGGPGAFLRRTTLPEPTKSGVIGLLAAAAGRDRAEAIDDLVALRIGVRTDASGVLLRDYHLVSDYRGFGLPTAAVTKAGGQRRRNPRRGGLSQVTERMYLADAVFVVAVRGPVSVIDTLARAVRSPTVPLALGRRSCPPSRPLLIDVRDDDLLDALQRVPWQASAPARQQFADDRGRPATIDLPVTVEDANGPEMVRDVPTSFAPGRRFTTRMVRRCWVSAPSGFADPDPSASGHDPFALLGW